MCSDCATVSCEDLRCLLLCCAEVRYINCEVLKRMKKIKGTTTERRGRKILYDPASRSSSAKSGCVSS